MTATPERVPPGSWTTERHDDESGASNMTTTPETEATPRTPALKVDPEILADVLAEARMHAEEVEAYVSEQMRDEMHRHDFDAPDDSESGIVFTFGHYRKLGRIVSLLRDLSLSIPVSPRRICVHSGCLATARPYSERCDDHNGSHQKLVNALSDFLENPQFQVGVGGNPIVVDKMLADARAALNLARGASP